MRTSWTLALLLLSSTAVADRRQFSGRFDLIPAGEIRSQEADLAENSVDTDMGYGIGGTIEFPIARRFSLGFAPRYLFHVNGEPHRNAGSQLDLAARAKARFPINPRTTLFGYLAPGYSMVGVPDGSIFKGLDPAGLILGIGGGGDFMISPSTFITIELGYTWGFQSDSEDGFKYTYATNLLHLGFGIGAQF